MEEKLNDINVNTCNSELNDQLISSINTSAEQTLPEIPKERLHQPWHDDALLRELYEFKDQQILQNANSADLSNTRKRIRIRAMKLKNDYYRAEAEKINRFAIHRELDKLFSRAKQQESTLKPAPGKWYKGYSFFSYFGISETVE